MHVDISLIRNHLLNPEKIEQTQALYTEAVELYKQMQEADRLLVLFQILGKLADSGLLSPGEFDSYMTGYAHGAKPSPAFLATINVMLQLQKLQK